MKIINIIYLFLLVAACTPTSPTPPPATSYELLTPQEQSRVDTILDEFKRHHLFFLPELGDMQNLVASTARGEDSDPEAGVSNKEDEHDHGSPGDPGYQDEHLDIKITQAFPDKDGQYHTPTIQLTPVKMYTYETLYTVSIKSTSISVTATKVEENKPERIPAEPEPDFIKSLAQRLKGQVTGQGIITVP